MSWFGFGGKKKKQTPEEVYKVKLDQLQKLGYNDRVKNLQNLKLYAGDVNLVIQDYQVQQPSSKSPEKQDNTPKQKSKPQPKQEPKPQPKPQANTQPKQQPKQEPPKQEQKQDVKPIKKQAVKPIKKQDVKPIKKQGLPSPTDESEPTKISNEQKTSNETPKSLPKSKEYSGAKMAQAKLKTDITKDTPKEVKKELEMLNNLNKLISSDIRQLLINIGEPQIAEIILSNGINGNDFYNYQNINPLLKKFNISFADKSSYNYLVNQVEISYKKNGAINIYNQPEKESKEETKQEIETKKELIDDKKAYELLSKNISGLISSDVRLLIQPYNYELSERLYAYSINGNDLCTFDYETVCFITGIKGFTKENWNKIVNELSLPQTQKFDKNKWNKLKQEQENVINKAKNMDKKIKNIIKNVQTNNKSKPKVEEKEEKAPPQRQNNNKLYKKHMKQLHTIIQMEKQTDKFLPQNLQKLKARQLQTLTTLHDVASIIGLNSKIINDIHKSAKKQANKDLQNYLQSVDPNLAGQSQIRNINHVNQNKYNNITPQELENRQIKLLSTINQTRKRLQNLAQKKGVSLDALMNIKSKINVEEKDIDINALDQQLNNLLSTLSSMALEIRDTANKRNVNINNKEVDELVLPFYNDLETKQNNLIAKIEYLNDQARMINPKAVQVNEEILHISGRSHTRSLSGPLHLTVPHSPGESPTPQDHFPDTGETKVEYDHLSEHPGDLPHKHSRSPSLSAGIKITSPDETEREANQVRQRRKSLQNNSVLLKRVLNKYDKDNSGYLSKDEFVTAVKEININMNEKDIKILNDVSDNKGVNVKKLINYVEEIHLTLKLDSSKQWNSFRMKIISAKQRR